MNYKQQAPAEAQGVQGLNSFERVIDIDKDSQSFSKIRRNVYQLFLTGDKFTAADITFRLGVCDPRGHIRDLRRRGVRIIDYWTTSANGNRCKLYFINPDNLNAE